MKTNASFDSAVHSHDQSRFEEPVKECSTKNKTNTRIKNLRHLWPPQSRRAKSNVMVAASEDIPIILPVQKTIIEQIVIKPSLTASGLTRVNTA